MTEQSMLRIMPCICGCADLITWLPAQPAGSFDDMLALEKIECTNCGRVIYGSDEDAIKSWNAGKSD
jgi:hypothetical protein